MKKVLGVSLGSSTRDHKVVVEILGEKVEIERRGTDGDVKKMIQIFQENDGKVDIFSLGGTDLYFFADPHGKRYTHLESKRIVDVIKKTPIVDGTGIKYILEKDVVNYIVKETGIPLKNKKALIPITVDRFGLALGLVDAGCQMTFGDLIFALNIPVKMHSLKTIKILATLAFPILMRVPMKQLYPTGKKQIESDSRYTKYFVENDIIAGDYISIGRYMPENMVGKIIITNTVTSSDVEKLKRRGVSYLVTTTPEFEGRSFGTNVFQATLVAISGKSPEELQPEDYLKLIEKTGFKPRIEKLN